jgi:hypothetical protein
MKSFARVTFLTGVVVCVMDLSAVPRLTLGTARGFPGNTVEVPVSLRYGTNDLQDVVALQADVVFDASGLSEAAPAGGTILGRHVLVSSRPTAGVRRLLVYSLENAALTNGVVATIPFTVGPKEYRNFALTLANVILVRTDGSQVFGSNVDGFIGVSQVFVAPDGHADGFLNVVSNEVEQCYVIQATTDFVTWVNLQTNSVAGNLLEFNDSNASAYPHRFYRAILCASPAAFAAGGQIGTITQLTDGRVQFDFSGANGRSYVIQASTNLTFWENIRTNVGAGGPIVFTDSVTNYPQWFYRVRPQ